MFKKKTRSRKATEINQLATKTVNFTHILRKAVSQCSPSHKTIDCAAAAAGNLDARAWRRARSIAPSPFPAASKRIRRDVGRVFRHDQNETTRLSCFFNCHDQDREHASAGEFGEKQRFDLRSLMMSRA